MVIGGLESIYRLSIIVNMVDNLSGPSAIINQNLSESQQRIIGMQKQFASMAKSGAVLATLGANMTKSVLAPVEATFETKKALGELSSVGIENLEALEKAGKDFSDQWAGTTKADFISSAYDIKSGIASLSDEAVAEYTKIAGITAKGTKASVDEMTSLFATGYGIYKDFYKNLDDMEFAEVFSAGIAKSVQQFKTDGSQMAQAISTLGATATTAQVPLEEQLSILGMLQATMGGGEAGTKYTAFLKGAAKAGEELGLKFTDANNQLLSMPEILSRLKGKFGETMDAAEKMELQKAFGRQEAVQLIDLLYNKTGDLENNIMSMNSTLGQGTEIAQEMADKINSTEGEQYEVLKQQIQNLKEEIGNQLLPTVVKWMAKGKEYLSQISNWVEEHQGLVSVIMHVALGIGILLTVLGTFLAVTGAIGMGIMGTINTFNFFKNTLSILRPILKNAALGLWNMGRQAIITAVRAMPGLIASVWSFTTALLANPITWIIVGIIALSAALIWLYNNWDMVSDFLTSVFTGSVEEAKNMISSLVGFLANTLGNMISTVFGKLGEFKESGKKLMSTFVEGIKSMAMKPYEAIKGALSKARKLLPFSDAKEGPLSELTLSGRRIFETINIGMQQTKDLPYQTTNLAFAGIGGMQDFQLEQEKPTKLNQEKKVQRINLREILKEKSQSEAKKETYKNSGKKVVIEHLELKIEQVKEMAQFLKLMQDFVDYNESNFDGDDEE